MLFTKRNEISSEVVVPSESDAQKLAELRASVNKTLKHWEGRHCDAAWYADLRRAYARSS